MPEPFTELSRHRLMQAQDHAWQAGSTVIEPEHLLLALLDAPAGDAVVATVASQGADLGAIRHTLESPAPPAQVRTAQTLPFGNSLKTALQQAFVASVGTGSGAVTPEHLLLGLMADSTGVAARTLAAAGCDLSSLHQRILADLGAGADAGTGAGAGQTPALPEIARRLTGWGGTERSLSTQSMRAALLRYRIMAYIVGTLLSILCFVGLPLQFAAHNDIIVDVVGTIHGYCYLIYLAIAYDMARRVRWRIGRLIPVALGGLVPGLAFFMERRITPQVQADIDQAAFEEQPVPR
jgi:integral membrane protein